MLQWYFAMKIILTLSEKLFYLSKKKFEITIYLNNEKSEEFFKQNTFLNGSSRFIGANNWDVET